MAIFGNVENLKAEILRHSPSEFFDEFVVAVQTPHFDASKLLFVAETIRQKFNVELTQDELVVVGSSKLGFALHKKYRDREIVGHEFRPFDENSDIDLSLCSPQLFSILWHEVSEHLSSKAETPYRERKLGDYLGYGWLRPDQIPRDAWANLIKLRYLREVRAIIQRDRNRGHPFVNFGVFYDIEHLKIYQSRSINICRQKLEKPL